MKSKKVSKKDNSPKLKQTKISAFCFKKSEKRAPDNDDDLQIIQAPKKFAEGTPKKTEKEESCENTPPEMVFKSPVKKSREALKILNNLENVEEKIENFDDVDFDFDFFKSPKGFSLDLSRGELCTVVEIQPNLKNEQSLIVKAEKGEERGCVKLRDVWAYALIKIDDVLAVKAVKISDEWVVDSKNGYVSLSPSQLVTSTALVGAMFCMRRAVLSNFFKGFDPGNKIMVIGKLVHEMLQSSLRKSSCSETDILKILDDLLMEKDVLMELYSCGMTFEEISLELRSFVPKIMSFLDRYVTGKDPPEKGFRNRITEVVDIEEDVVSNTLGMKGRIDVTVKIDNGKTMPLELKTGRASFSNEHKSQVVLYTMILNELGRKVDSGLLLYIRDGIFEEVKATHLETRDLILLRNQMVGWLKSFKNFELPDPVRFEKACAKCPYLTICHAFLQNNNYDDLSPNHPMRGMPVPEIEKNHLGYFVKWMKFCFMENEDVVKSDKSSVLNRLELQEGVTEFKNEFKHVFKKDEKVGHIPPGSFVSVNDDKNKRICFGRIVNCTSTSVSVLSDKEMKNLDSKYSLMTYDSNLINKYLTNLGVLLEETYRDLREIVIDKRSPKIRENFEKTLLNEEIVRILKPLNKEQRKAIFTVLSTEDYCLIKGPPGTGKTQTVVALIKILVKLNKSILITGHTHSSVDNILLRLNDVEFLRFGSLKSVNQNLHPRCFNTLIDGCKTIGDVKYLYEAQVVATTCLGVDPDLIDKRKFDICLVDESSQVLQPETLKPLFCCKKFVLIGDSDQLPPIVRNREAKKLGMDESLFQRLENESSTISLKRQYRMNQTINRLANKITYKDLLECADERTADATIALKNFKTVKWIQDVLSPDIKRSVIFVDTSEYFKRNDSAKTESCSSFLEKNIVLKIAKTLVESGMPENDIGIISPFRAQVELIQSQFLKNDLKYIDVSTVDQYQGRDKEVIVYSCAKENQINKITEEFELLNDKRRLTVAVTRAKHKLIVVGDMETVKAYEPLEKLIKCLNEQDIVRLKEGERDFSWDELND